MSGTINLSLTQQVDEYGEPLSSGQIYFIQAGTVATPQNAYQDTALTIPWPNPITLDSAGRIPQFFLADGQIKVRLQDKFGVVKFVADNLLVIGPSSGGGGGGGGSVDPTTVLQTGDLKFRYDTAILTGFVRLNAKTIGSATSGASELADLSAQALFNYLWGADISLAVSGGRGVSAAADWAANKQLTLPDGRARLMMALADMGNSDVGLLAGLTFLRGGPTTLGGAAGAARRTIDNTILPAHQHAMYLHDPGHAHSYNNPGIFGNAALGPGAGYEVIPNSANTGASVTGITHGSVPGVANDNLTTSVGSGVAFDIVSPFLLITVYMKL